MVRDFSHMNHLDLQKGWRLSSAMWAVNHGAQIRTVDTKSWGKLPWVVILHGYCHKSTPGSNTVHNSTGKQLEAPHLQLSCTLSYAPLCLADFNQYSLAIKTCNHEYKNSMSSVNPSELSYLRIVLGSSLQLVSEVKMILWTMPPLTMHLYLKITEYMLIQNLKDCKFL